MQLGLNTLKDITRTTLMKIYMTDENSYNRGLKLPQPRIQYKPISTNLQIWESCEQILFILSFPIFTYFCPFMTNIF